MKIQSVQFDTNIIKPSYAHLVYEDTKYVQFDTNIIKPSYAHLVYEDTK